ncbi:microsomal signal peptidase 12 kDa subunit-domain-containing protein [Chaetomium sp. MPI-SDFR-AT-0129]|nr:microsomal signal peptidase 12 kDa subunit-domain-containing protein [Chaetomium sp. MPI-SDFR-AT-0129]
MAEQLLEQARDIFEGQIDFEGQKLVELLVNAVAFLVGYFLQDIKLAVYIGLIGTAAVFLLAVPPWPFYNRHPVKWLPVGGVTPPANLVVDDKMFR